MPLDDLHYALCHLRSLLLHLLTFLVMEIYKLIYCSRTLVAPSPEVYTPITVLVLARIASLTRVRWNWVPIY
jgi:hypothetical protein